MKHFTLNGLFMTVVFMLLCCLSIHADDDLITEQVTIKLDKAGTLSDIIGEDKKYRITNLKLIGEVNGTDWFLIRDMMGRRGDNLTKGRLCSLDLSETKIVNSNASYIYPAYNTFDNKISDYAFRGCRGLTSLILPPSITEIGEFAFYGCRRLKSLNIPSGVTKIGEAAFESCDSLTNLSIPSGITKINARTFTNCDGLVSLRIPSSVTEIGEFAFCGCNRLTNLTIPSGVVKIGDNAFSQSGLTSLKLP